MKKRIQRWGPLAIVALLLIAGIAVSEWRRVSAPAGPNALLYMLADTQRELTRLPVAFTALSDADEIRIGNSLARRYAGMTAEKSNDLREIEVRRYVEEVGARVAAHAHRRLPYRFHYIPNPYFINAFAIPGGHVYVGAGLLALMNNEDELAAVLGHEIEHIDHRHAAERVQMESALRGLPLGGLLAIPVEVFEAGYTKDEELEADREGTRLAVAAGYSPEGAIQMFQGYQKLERQMMPAAHAGPPPPQGPAEELSRVAFEMLVGYFRSHPPNADRITQIRRLIAAENWDARKPERPLAVAWIFLTARAGRALARRDYKQAAKLASQSLDLHPDQPSALSTLAQANLALGNSAAATDAYRKLVDEHPGEADAIRAFADRLAKEAMEARDYKKAEALAAESLVLQPGRVPALVMLGEARLALGDGEGAGEVVRTLQEAQPGAAEPLLAYAAFLGSRAFDAGHFDEAARFASFRVKFAPGRPDALRHLAEAEFAAGRFAAAASAYRNLLDGEIAHHQPLLSGFVVDYAEALGAARLGSQAVVQFEDLLARASPQAAARPLALQVDLAGLKLLAGDAAPAGSLAKRASSPAGGVPPELLSRLGWWYYRAGNYAAAESVLRQGAALRPGDAALENNLGWVNLERNRLEEAVQRFTLAGNATRWTLGPLLWNSPGIGRAIAHWRLRQADDALKDFEPAVSRHTPWLHPEWVKAVYSAGVAGSVAEIMVERERREEEKRRKMPPPKH
jgi:predicted Zn-dependent protease